MSVVNTTVISRNARSLALRQYRYAPAGLRTIHPSAGWRNADSGREVDIRGKLKDALKAAMKGKDKEAVGCIRSLMADITYHEKSGANPNEPANEDTVIDVLRKAVDKRSQAAEAYDKDHPSRKQFQDEIAMISKFLPSTLPVEQITQILEGIVAGMSESDRSSKGATGQVLKAFWAVVKKGEVQDKKALGKMIGEMLKK